MENQIRIADKKTTPTKILKKNMTIYSDEAKKLLLERRVQLEGTNQKVQVKEGRLKIYRDMTKQNRTFQNNERKFYQQVGGEWEKTYQLLDAKEAKQFGAMYGNGKIITKKPDGQKKNIETEWRMLEGNTPRWTQSNTKNTQLESPGLDSIRGFWFEIFTSVHDKLGYQNE